MTGVSAPRRPDRLRCWLAAFVAAALPLAVLSDPRPAAAQTTPQSWVGIPPPPATPVPTASRQLTNNSRDPNAQMLVQADEIQYNYNGEQVAAVGSVQIHYAGSVLQADRVVYEQKTKRLFAEGNVRLTEADGKAVTADRLQLSSDFRNGFVDSLHVEMPDKSRMSAARADIGEGTQDGRLTVFQSGIYTACEPCKDNPQAPPKWQVRAARIVHDEKEQTIYFEDAAFELFGLPIAYLPYFWMPDPTVKKKTGFLMPRIMNGSYYGFGAQVPFFWNLAPDYDLTLAPGYLSKQGLLMTVEWRQRLMNGAYAIRASGIFQQDRAAFVGTTGDREFRGAIETKGDFRLAKNWWYGWDASLFTDNSFAPQYKVTRQGQEAVSQAYLFGRGANSYFDLRAMHFYGLSPLDVQKQLPILHPLLDYKYKFGQPILGGELSYAINVTSLSRQQADYDPITGAAAASGVCDNTAAIKTKADCVLRGIPGEYTRLSATAQWKRTIVDPFGQMFTPFAWVRADVAAVTISPDASIANFITPGDRGAARITPAIGLDYKYPFISAHSWGTQIIQPRAQVIIRPNETGIGKFPNEDSQSLLFDDANLFAISKFSGFDRAEGGGRANVGLEYTAQFNQGGYFNALFGQSYQLFGVNSYAVADMVNTGLNSGLETPRSDYVARMTFKPNSTYTFTSRFRFDEQTFSTKRLELESRVNFDRWSASVTYGQYDSQPLAGMLLPREGILPAATFKLSPNWSVSASALYSLDSNRLNTISFGVGYIDDCIAINATYQENYGYLGSIVPNRVYLLGISLRTLGGTNFTQTAGGIGGSTAGNSLGL
ncbi:MAG: LPS-assembly protein LptD [Hyphomicrobiales bacterium]|nr:LPS-assembly protein LptD [Hyphomicrobiales bacterium]